MNEKTKNYLGWAIIVAVLGGAGALWSLTQTYSKSVAPSAFRSFSVSGQGRVVARPDVARFTFSVINEGGTDIAALERDNTARGNTINSFLKEQGIAAKDIKTEQYNLSPRYQNTYCRSGPCPPPAIVGYTVTQSVAVKIRDFTKIGAILSGVVARGANNVSQLNFTIDDPVAVENEARAEAIAEAREKAKIVARAGGFSVGRLLGIDEGGSPPFYVEKFGRAISLEDATDETPLPTPAIEPGAQDVVVNVILRYEIK